MNGLRHWLFRTLFRGECEHMQHLVDDVARLEREKADREGYNLADGKVVADSNSTIEYLKP